MTKGIAEGDARKAGTAHHRLRRLDRAVDRSALGFPALAQRYADRPAESPDRTGGADPRSQPSRLSRTSRTGYWPSCKADWPTAWRVTTFEQTPDTAARNRENATASRKNDRPKDNGFHRPAPRADTVYRRGRHAALLQPVLCVRSAAEPVRGHLVGRNAACEAGAAESAHRGLRRSWKPAS